MAGRRGIRCLLLLRNARLGVLVLGCSSDRGSRGSMYHNVEVCRRICMGIVVQIDVTCQWLDDLLWLDVVLFDTLICT
jgi:hypothetical protein